MKMNNTELDQILDKITEGVKLSIHRLIERTKKEDGELVISKDGYYKQNLCYWHFLWQVAGVRLLNCHKQSNYL